jgi:hypothetical protein
MSVLLGNGALGKGGVATARIPEVRAWQEPTILYKPEPHKEWSESINK